METNLLKYRAFTEIGEGKSFTEASEILGVSQSGISRMISDLEADWGFRLFERDRNGVQLTREGDQTLRERCEMLNKHRETVIERMEEMQRHLDKVTWKCNFFSQKLKEYEEGSRKED